MADPDRINLKPTPRHGWWLMVLMTWDVLFWRRGT